MRWSWALKLFNYKSQNLVTKAVHNHPFVQLSTRLRKVAKIKFQKNLYEISVVSAYKKDDGINTKLQKREN